MTRLFLFLLMTNVLALAHSQEIKHFKPDLSEYEGNYDALIEEIQEKRYVINDTTFEVLDNAAAHYRSSKDKCSLSHVYAVKAVMYFIKGVHDSAEFNFINSDKTIQPECSDFNQYYLYFYWGKLQF